MSNKIKIDFDPDISNLKLGVSLSKNGALFSIFSRNAVTAWILLFNNNDADKPDFVYELSKDKNKTGEIWHIFVEGITAGWHYLWKFDGSFDTKSGLLFNKEALILDPYAKAITGIIDSYPEEKKESYQKFISDPKKMVKGIVCNNDFNWEKDRPLKIPLEKTIIYEINLKGLTAHLSSNVNNPGTYEGLIEKIPYLKELGITAIELLPVNEFSSYRDNRSKPDSKEVLNNYWGYNTLGYFSPNGLYAIENNFGEQVPEFKKMVKELHKAGIEVIIDIVFNHTVEGGKFDKIISYKGIDNNIYYMRNSKKNDYLDYTGCGNTFNCNHPIVSDLILDCLHYWVLEMHIDGFRFDLASALNRDESGNLLEYSPLIKRIEESPLLRDTKIIAEAWDAGGGYQVGGFKGRWAEWNGKYRDDVRKFWRGDKGSLGDFATRITGSSDLFYNRTPQQSINFIFSHDGFTMWDWASYNNKHNFDNGHNNEDGDNNNFSFNHGIEGETTNKKINKIRKRQSKNFIATLLLSLGTPMLNGGDEFLRTQMGNNNPYCQDNEISWFNWELLQNNKDIFVFYKNMIKLRKELYPFFERDFYTAKSEKKDGFEINWFGPDGNKPDWDGKNLSLGVFLKSISNEKIIILFNSNNKKTFFTIPFSKNNYIKTWKKIVDTAKPSPFDITPEGEDLEIKNKTSIECKSLIVLKLI